MRRAIRSASRATHGGPRRDRALPLVVVMTAGLYASGLQDPVAREILDNYVLAAIRA